MGFFSGLAGALGGAGKAMTGGTGSAPTGGVMGAIANKVTAARSAQGGGGGGDFVQEDRPSLLGTIAKNLAGGRGPIRVRRASSRGMSMTGRR